MKQILIILLTIFFIFYLCIHLNFYYYSSPYINFENLKEISGIINKINKAVKESIKTENNIKISFINTYGSNYVRNNNIPNNLVQEIQFDLGDFYYNEENINEIAIEINNKINKIRSNLYKTLKEKNNNFYFLSSEKEFFSIQDQNISLIKKQLLKREKRIEYLEYSSNKGRYYIAEKNEIYITDIPIILYTNYKSGKNTKKYLREVFIPLGYSFALKNKKNKEKQEIEIVPTCRNVVKANYRIRRFAPNIFFKPNKNITNLQENNNEFCKSMLISITEHMGSIQGYLYNNYYIKVIKRFLQLKYITNFIFEKSEQEKIYKIINKNLNSKEIIFLNEYRCIYENSITITENKNLRETINYRSFQNELLSELIQITNEIEESKLFTTIEIKDIKDATENLKSYISNIYEKPYNNKDNEKLSQLRTEAIQKINTISINYIYNYDIIKAYINKIYNFIHNIGIFDFTLIIINENNIGILKSNIPNDLSYNELKQALSDYGFKNFNLQIIDNSNNNKYPCYYKKIWIKIENFPKNQKNNYENAKKIIQKEKNKYNMKKKLYI